MLWPAPVYLYTIYDMTVHLLRYYFVVYVMAKCLLIKGYKKPFNLLFAELREVYKRFSRSYSTGTVVESA